MADGGILFLDEIAELVLDIQGKLLRALQASSGNKTKAAELMGITPRTLFRLLADHDKNVLDPDENVME